MARKRGTLRREETKGSPGHTDTVTDPTDTNVALRERTALKRGLAYLLPHRVTGIAILGCVIIRALLDIIPAYLTKELIDHALPAHNSELLNVLVALMVITPTIYESLGVWQNYANAYVTYAVTMALQRDLYDRFLHLPLPYHVQNRSGEAMSRLMNDCGAMNGLLMGNIPMLLRDTSKILTTVVVAFYLSPILTVTALAIYALYIIPTRIFAAKQKAVRKETQSQLASFTEFVRERLTAGLLIKYSATEDEESDAFESELKQVVGIQVRAAVLGRLLGAWGGVIRALGTAVIYGIGGAMVIYGQTTIGTLAAFTAYLASLYQPIQTWSGMYVEIVQVSSVLDRIFTAMDLPVEPIGPVIALNSAANAETAVAALGDRTFLGHIAFERVTFRHQDGGPPVADEVSFQCEPGEVIAFVGRSGSGKSTLLDLIHGLVRPEKGSIFVDHISLEELDIRKWRQRTAVVAQDTLLWNETLLSNIRYGCPDITLEEVHEACRDAQLHEWIVSLPDGYETLVGQRGQQLSGGQRQRVSIARALLRDPDVLLLDEATSALDTETERAIMDAVRRRFHGRTIVIVAHRLSTVRAADRIYVMDSGQIVEVGTHEELLIQGSTYASLYDREEQLSRIDDVS